MPITVPEHFKVIQALRPGTTMNTGSTGDWVNLQNFQSMTVLIDVARPTAKAIYAEFYSASDSAGTGTAAITTGVTWWKRDGVGSYRLSKATSSPSSHTDASSTGLYQIVAQFKPSVLPTSDPWVACGVRNSSQATNFVNMVYLLESRYLPANQILATTSST